MQNVEAGIIKIGPVPDFKGIKTVTVKTTLDTGFKVPLSFGFWGYDLCSFNIDLTDKIDVKINVPVPVYAASYFEIAYPDEWDNLPPLLGNIFGFFNTNNTAKVIDVWAKDENPLGTDIVLSGFNSDPALTELIPLSDEIFIGKSGVEYQATILTKTVADLSSLLPGHNVDAFKNASPSGIIYFATTEIPISVCGDGICIPEPSLLALWGIGALGMAVAEKRRRKQTA